jgi:hypothetical protein
MIVAHEKPGILNVVKTNGFLDGPVQVFEILFPHDIDLTIHILMVFEGNAKTVNGHKQ